MHVVSGKESSAYHMADAEVFVPYGEIFRHDMDPSGGKFGRIEMRWGTL